MSTFKQFMRISIFPTLFVIVFPCTLVAQTDILGGKTVYVWDFAARNGEMEDLTASFTEEFEEALIQTRRCTILERRNHARLFAQKQSEKKIMSLEQVEKSKVESLKSLHTNIVIFGEIVDDTNSGQLKVSVSIQNFDGQILTKESIFLARGKRIDVDSRRQAMRDLVQKISTSSSSAIEVEKLRANLDSLRSLLAEKQRQIDELTRQVSTLKGPSQQSSTSAIQTPYSAPAQNTKWFKASVTKVIVQSGGDVVVFFEYFSNTDEDYQIGLSGCPYYWYTTTYVVDNVGNIFPAKTLSGIGIVGCGSKDDPVSLTAGGTATFSIVFERPREFERKGTTYSLSSAQHVGRIGADGIWRNISNLNISLRDLIPNQ